MKTGNIILLGIAGFFLFNSFKKKEVKPVDIDLTDPIQSVDEDGTPDWKKKPPYVDPYVDNSTTYLTRSPYVDQYGRPDGSIEQGLVPIFIKRFDQNVERPEWSTQAPSTFAPFAFLYTYFVERMQVEVYEEAFYYHAGEAGVKICRVTDFVEPDVDLETATEYLQNPEQYFKNWVAQNPKANDMPYKQMPSQTMLNRNLWVLKANLVKGGNPLNGIKRSI